MLQQEASRKTDTDGCGFPHRIPLLRVHKIFAFPCHKVGLQRLVSASQRGMHVISLYHSVEMR